MARTEDGRGSVEIACKVGALCNETGGIKKRRCIKRLAQERASGATVACHLSVEKNQRRPAKRHNRKHLHLVVYGEKERRSNEEGKATGRSFYTI